MTIFSTNKVLVPIKNRLFLFPNNYLVEFNMNETTKVKYPLSNLWPHNSLP